MTSQSVKITTRMVDAALDTVGEDDSPAEALVSLVDDNGDWDYADEDSDYPRVAILESSGAFWAVGDLGRGDRRARRCKSALEAGGYVDSWCGA